ncbi:hypothetical protein QTP88_005769 [Uroleucon formosanum]
MNNDKRKRQYLLRRDSVEWEGARHGCNPVVWGCEGVAEKRPSEVRITVARTRWGRGNEKRK